MGGHAGGLLQALYEHWDAEVAQRVEPGRRRLKWEDFGFGGKVKA